MKKQVLAFTLGLLVASALPALCQTVLTYANGYLQQSPLVGAGSLLNSVSQSASQITLTGSRFAAVNAESGSFAAVAGQAYVVSATATATLPTAVGVAGQEIGVRNSSGSGTVTMASTSSQTVNGGAAGSTTIAAGAVKNFVSDGANWSSF